MFREAAQASLTTSVLYNCDGVDAASGKRFHCWITDFAIPLDELCRAENANQGRCSLAAFCCMLRAAQHGFYLSDCHFFNFGVLLSETATEHLVVIIDAGSRGIHPEDLWSKPYINKTVMHKFWKVCEKVRASCDEVQELHILCGNLREVKTRLKRNINFAKFGPSPPRDPPPCLQAQLGVGILKDYVFTSSSSYTGIPLNSHALSDTLTYHTLSDTLTESKRDEISLS